MSMWDVLTAVNTLSIDSKLNDIKELNEQYARSYEAQQSSHKEIEIKSKLNEIFEELYNNDNDIEKINHRNIDLISSYINETFKSYKYYKKPDYDYGIVMYIVAILVFGLIMSTIPTKAAGSIVFLVITFVMAGVASPPLLTTFNEIASYEKNTNKYVGEIKNLKKQFPRVSAYGVFQKWYFDSRLYSLMSSLDNKNDGKNVLETLNVVYKLFSLNAKPDLNYSWATVANFNAELINLYNEKSKSSKVLDYAIQKYNNKEFDYAFKNFMYHAEQGNEIAQHWIGLMYFNGDGVTQDYNEAYKWFLKACDGGNDASKTFLAYMYFEGLGTEKDFNKAYNIYFETAEGGHDFSKYQLARMYYYGYGTEINYDKAFYWFKESSLEVEESKLMLAAMTILGQGTEQDVNKGKNVLENNSSDFAGSLLNRNDVQLAINSYEDMIDKNDKQQIDKVEEILKFSNLKDQGIITDEEFNKEKEKILEKN